MYFNVETVFKNYPILVFCLFIPMSLSEGAPYLEARSDNDVSTNTAHLSRKAPTPDRTSLKSVNGASKVVNLHRRQQTMGTLLGSMAAIPYFGAQSAVNGLGNLGSSIYNGLGYAGYGMMNGISNLGMGLQNGFSGAMNSMQNSAYNMPYYNSMNNPYSSASQMTNPMGMMGQPMNPFNQNPMQMPHSMYGQLGPMGGMPPMLPGQMPFMGGPQMPSMFGQMGGMGGMPPMPGQMPYMG